MPAFSEVMPIIGDGERAGTGLPPVPKNLHKNNRRKLLNHLQHIASNSLVLLQGGGNLNHYNTDTVYQFRQESFFLWMYGVREPDFYGLLDIKTSDAILLIPRLPEEYATWMGPIPFPEGVTEKYGVDNTYYVDELNDILKKYNPHSILLLSGENTDSNLTLPPAKFDNKYKFELNTSLLYPIISECRVVKSPEEIEMISKACSISCTAHKYIMRKIFGCRYEYQAESLFMNACYYLGGARTTAYTNNCSSGCNCAILHYGDAGAPNEKEILPGDMCLFDMGASYSGYASDITISFPASGTFAPNQRIVYNAVLSARNAVIDALKPGVSWPEMHILANKIMLQKLTDAKLLTGNVEEMLKAGVSGVLQPHGLGHLLGIDVHDVGGYLDNTPPRPEHSWLKSLRTARILEEGVVLTVEPGCYFIDPLLDKALSNHQLSKFFIKDQINKFRGSGGVRIEDVVVVTRNGCRVLSPLPRTIEEVEAWMKSSDEELKQESH